MKILPFTCLIIALTLPSCGGGSGAVVTRFQGKGWHSFQEGEYRTYVILPKSQWDSCNATTHLIDLLSRGLLHGRDFYEATRLDSNDLVPFLSTKACQDSIEHWQPKVNGYSTKNYEDAEYDIEAFRGRPVFIAFVSIGMHRIGVSRDTVEFGLSADLTGYFPGPMARFRIVVSFDSSSQGCRESFLKPALEHFRFDGYDI